MQERNRKKPPPRPERDKQPKRTPAEQQQDSEDVERAVYDGMQDLRAEREKKR